ncbi:hypothetical protein HPB51_008186 [Rhipicephalus microplus]|uniref:DUF7041 domain-containing protein n=1 Tax=Rhipicephalus microplus TaxID=6941 RepID=A0A9J6E8X9_RHIMP|nr:hypothetical protein HPB51_008186 [Rhipicephalus microplus]
MFPQLCPPVPPFQSTYPKVWFMQLDAVLAVNGITDQLLMHAILLDALPVELRHLAATSSTSPQPYDALCTAVLARSGNTYRPLPFTRTRHVSPASQSKVRTGPQPSIDRYLGTPASTTSTPDPVAETSTPAPDHDREVENSPTATDLPSERYIPSEPPCRASSHVPATCTFSKKVTARDTEALAVSATTSSDVSASSSPQLLVSSSTVPPAAPPPATGASNGLPGASPHSTRTSPASSRPPSASPLPAPVPVSVSWSMTGPSAVSSRSQSLPSSSASIDTGNHQSNCHRRPSARGAAAGTCVETRRRTGGFGQPQSSHLWCPPAHPAETATDPAQAVERQREHDDAFGSGDHPVPVSSGGPAQGHTAARACTGAAACDHGAARSRDGAQHGESAAHQEPRGSAAGHVSGWTCARHFSAEPVHSGPGPQPDSDTRHTGADPELSGTDTVGPAGPAATPCHGPDPGTSDGAQAPWGTSRTTWHPDACHSTEPGAKAQHLSGTATHDVAPPRLP